VQPALSVILFTTLSGAGYGILIWLGVLILMAHSGDYLSEGTPILLWGASLLVASGLIAVGLVSSMLHLGKPGRAWRAFSQWRTSWLSREGVMSLVTYLPVAVLLALLAAAVTHSRRHSPLDTPLLPGAATAMVICAVVTVICTAMIYASLQPIPAWRHHLVVPGYVAFALLTGGTSIAAMSSINDLANSGVRSFAAMVAACAIVTGAIKLAYWHAIDMQSLPATRGDALGLPGRDISVFERPHTEDSYITREMAFAVARKHARRLRLIALVLFGAMPIVAAAAASWVPAAAAVAFVVAALGALAGAFVERWLFFAEARHVVTLYY
jgi:DMSO reductase anchor subunit